MIQSHQHVATVEITTNLETIRVAEDLHVYRRTRSGRLEGEQGDFRVPSAEVAKSQATQGFLDDANLAAMLAGRSWTGRKLALVTAAGRELFREVGFARMDWDALKEQMPSAPFDEFAAGNATIADVVEPDFGNHLVFRIDGSIMPTAISFDYTSGRIRSGVYDLEVLAEHLLRRDDVRLFPTRYRHSHYIDYAGRAQTADEALIGIPDYNDGGYGLSFVWSPDDDAMAELEEWTRENIRGRNPFPSDLNRAAFETDVLGLRSSGAFLLENYHDEVQERTYEDDDTRSFRP